MRLLLFPFGLLYDLVTSVRNMLYDRGLWKSKKFDFPIIGVGNLKVGGTGKTPMSIYLLQLLTDRTVATLSRGYGRSTKGFRMVAKDDDVSLVGDEPALIKSSVDSALVAVDENRVNGVNQLRELYPDLDTIILDDVFQHRAIKPGHMILLTAFDDLYINDLLLPGGRLRESSRGASRANTIVVTKCPADLSLGRRQQIIQSLKIRDHQKVFFAYEQFGSMRAIRDYEQVVDFRDTDQVLLVTGIARATTLLAHFQRMGKKVEHMRFRDHHSYTESDMKEIKRSFEGLSGNRNVIVTTQKDAQRLRALLQNENFAALPIYAIEHEMEFFEEDREAFQLRIDEYINSY